MSVLTGANREWESRPADERFGSLQDMHKAALAFLDNATQVIVPVHSLSVRSEDDGLLVDGSTGTTATLTHFSFSQLAQKAGAPAAYLRNLPAKLAADCINTGLHDVDSDDQGMLLFDRRGALRLRGITSEKYARIWNSDVTERLLTIEAEGPWQPAPAAFDGSRGLYLGDRDMFAFMVDNNRRIFEKGPGGGLSRGFFMWNSEVGARSIGVATFLYEYVCGNHRVWGAKDVKELGFRILYRDSGGRVTDYERAAIARVGRVDLALVAVSGDYINPLMVKLALEQMRAYKPDVMMPAHHDAPVTAGHVAQWRATEPLFEAMKDENPNIVTVSREYREPICFNTEMNVQRGY